jgi:signal transduction histidine kinase
MIFYVMLRKIMVDRTDNRLIESKNLIENNFHIFLQDPKAFILNEELVSVSMVNGDASTQLRISDTIIGNKMIGNLSPFRKIEFEHNLLGQTYKVKVFKDLSFTDDITLQVMFLLSLLAVFFILSFFVVFRFTVQSSLFDFYDTVKKIRAFKVGGEEKIDLYESDVEEFENLNKVLRFMTNKINQDYQNLKEFTQNASHEIQTPLAIIQNKVELLIQNEGLNDSQIEAFSTILEATSRLSKLNQGLTQLVKIEGGQYISTSEIVISDNLDKSLEYLEEMLDSKDIKIKKEYIDHIKVDINENLLELLVFNLLKNALKHNIQGGEINIRIEKSTLCISNTGPNKAFDFQSSSKRFIKGKDSKSLGLGLAIVMKICQLYDIGIVYKFEDKKHRLTLNFEKLL